MKISGESKNNHEYFLFHHLLSALLLIVHTLHFNHILRPCPGPHVPLQHPEQLLGEDGEDSDNRGYQDFK